MKRLQDRIALITGAGAGIGKGIARRFAAKGATIVLVEYHPEIGAQAAAEVRRDFGVEAEFVRADVSQRADVEAMVKTARERFGKVDILVNNAWSRRQGGFGRAASGPRESKSSWTPISITPGASGRWRRCGRCRRCSSPCVRSAGGAS